MSCRPWTLAILMSILLCGGPARTQADDSLKLVDFQALRLAIRDLSDTFPQRYAKGEAYLRQLDALEKRLPQIRKGLQRGDARARSDARQIVALKREALLANPLLDFDRLLLIRRKPLGDPRRAKADGKGLGKVLGLPQQSSWQLDTMPNTLGWENDVAVLSPVRPEGTLTTVYESAVCTVQSGARQSPRARYGDLYRRAGDRSAAQRSRPARGSGLLDGGHGVL